MKDDEMTDHLTNTLPEGWANKTNNDKGLPSLFVVKTLIVLFVLGVVLIKQQLLLGQVPSNVKINKTALNQDFVQLPKGLSVHPIFIAPNDTFVGRSINNTNVDLYIARYADYFNSREMISESNDIYQNKNWSLIDEKTRSVVIKNKTFSYNLIRLASKTDTSKTIIFWYQLPGKMESNKAKVKIWQGVHKLLGDYDQGAFVAFTIRELDPKNSELDNLVKSYYGVIQKALGYSDSSP
jgi:hypothetical protein